MTLRLTLFTAGDPSRLTGGHLYQRRMVDAAARHDARIRPVVMPLFPRGMIQARRVLSGGDFGDALLLDSLAAATAAPWLAGVGAPVVGVVHQVPGGVDGGRLIRGIQARLDGVAYRRARRLVVVSEFLADRLVAARIPRDRIAIVTPGRDPADAQPGEVVDLRQGRRAAVLCVGNWTRNKGIDRLVEALARLPRDSATLHLVGDAGAEPGYASRLHRRLTAEDVRGRVVVHGPLPPADVDGLLRAADVFALASLHESYGTVYAEAMAAGLPVVACGTDNLPYLIRDGVDGILVPPGDIAALTAALAALCDDPGRQARYGASARQRALTWPTWGDAADRFFAAIRETVRGGPST